MSQRSHPFRPSDVAFTPSVKAEQSRRGSRAHYARFEEAGGFQTGLAEFPVDFLSRIDTAYLGTANADGQPYIQHRGGPRGFIRVVGPRTLAFADRRGNRQYISTGNLADNPKAFLFLMDYEARARIKIWGEARFSDDVAAFAGPLDIAADDRTVERIVLFDVVAWDVNCPKYIPVKIDAAQVAEVVRDLRERIAWLEQENDRLRGGPTGGGPTRGGRS
ncbi:pyridoxamine 5'-phosphate oxidase family protein [Methyloraptor flagellatus]|jgi:predicted pyridoxine 5'-phosphate oxidase superfamily flavin-nucleotide-binding protein|uniref:Pyridoxamine 5'-phosphate oxidase family protein n=1 Tax=Methyloraptor flagellatus TaxID=3162530 RepID=A0AAU7XFM2_9HYPH